MGKFNFIKTEIKDLFVIEPTIFGDNRGYFMETYNEQEFKDAGLGMKFVQDNQSMSKKGVLRGMHYQTKHSQGKLVRVIQGEVYDVAVDLRKDSSTYGKWYGIILSDENMKQIYVPEGFAHGFLVMSDTAKFVYKVTDFYYPEYEKGFKWNDSKVGIEWPHLENVQIMVSDKDNKLGNFED